MKKTRRAIIETGMIVSVRDGSRYGVVKETFDHGGRTLHHIHYIDSTTGKLMQCPDSRCHGERTCPIHGQNSTKSHIVTFTQADIELFAEEGMIDSELLRDCPKLRNARRRTKTSSIRGHHDTGHRDLS